MQVVGRYTPSKSHARDVEASAHRVALTLEHYNDVITRCVLNCRNNPDNAGPHMAHATDRILMRDTILQRIYDTENERRIIWKRMLQEKYRRHRYQGRVRDKPSLSQVQLRRLDVGSEADARGGQKVRRSFRFRLLYVHHDRPCAGMTVYCVCATCNNRWTMR